MKDSKDFSDRLHLKEQSIDITFQNITYSVEIEDKHEGFRPPCSKTYTRKALLKDVSGVFRAGEVTAIMGASGAGKTTLLNVLACRVPRKFLEGKVCANDLEYTFENFGDFANYVMQADVLMQTLTVRETLEFAAHLKLNIGEAEKRERVMSLAQRLKLEKCLDVIVGGPIIKGISGGERKRTSIAFELISDPQVLILDEPTSGLDSLTSYIIVDYLKGLAKTQNKTVFMTIHQPNTEIFERFDRLLLLVEGKIIYQGPRN
jgi:ABC-type multidrug transport system ATPase subunit